MPRGDGASSAALVDYGSSSEGSPSGSTDEDGRGPGSRPDTVDAETAGRRLRRRDEGQGEASTSSARAGVAQGGIVKKRRLPPLPDRFVVDAGPRHADARREKVLPPGARRGDWLCHVYVEVPNDSLLAQTMSAALQRLHDEAALVVDGDGIGRRPAQDDFAQGRLQSAHDSTARGGEGRRASATDQRHDRASTSDASISELRPPTPVCVPEQHISLTRPILVRYHERDEVVRRVKAALDEQRRLQGGTSFVVGFSRFAHFVNDDATRIFFGCEVGSGWNELHALCRRLDHHLGIAFGVAPYYDEARFHCSFAYWPYRQRRDEPTEVTCAPTPVEVAGELEEQVEWTSAAATAALHPTKSQASVSVPPRASVLRESSSPPSLERLEQLADDCVRRLEVTLGARLRHGGRGDRQGGAGDGSRGKHVEEEGMLHPDPTHAGAGIRGRSEQGRWKPPPPKPPPPPPSSSHSSSRAQPTVASKSPLPSSPPPPSSLHPPSSPSASASLPSPIRSPPPTASTAHVTAAPTLLVRAVCVRVGSQVVRVAL